MSCIIAQFNYGWNPDWKFVRSLRMRSIYRPFGFMLSFHILTTFTSSSLFRLFWNAYKLVVHVTLT